MKKTDDGNDIPASLFDSIRSKTEEARKVFANPQTDDERKILAVIEAQAKEDAN